MYNIYIYINWQQSCNNWQQQQLKQERLAWKLAYGEMQYAIKGSLYINKWLSYSQL